MWFEASCHPDSPLMVCVEQTFPLFKHTSFSYFPGRLNAEASFSSMWWVIKVHMPKLLNIFLLIIRDLSLIATLCSISLLFSLKFN